MKKILLVKDFVTHNGNTLKAGREVKYEDLDGDLVVISYGSGEERFFDAVPPELLEEVTYGVVSRRPFEKP